MRHLLFALATTALFAQDLALIHARIYTTPNSPPTVDSTLVVRDGWIEALGSSSEVRVPENIRVIDCTGLTALPGFWNSHVHFTEAKWRNAQSAPASTLAKQLVEMLARYGFTSVFDTGSDTVNTINLRERIRKGEVDGPLILTTGMPLVPQNGTPYYVKPDRLAEVKTAEEGRRAVQERANQGVDAIKIFTGSWISKQQTVTMPEDVVAAITSEAHRLGLPVFAHPSDSAGIQAAVMGKVDILAHSEEVPGQIDSATMAQMMAGNMALIPTLKLFSDDDTLPNILRQVKSYSDLGGQILFGTDVGYLTDYEPGAEYNLLTKAGLSFTQVLSSMTTQPAARFGYAGRKGKLTPGMDADIVIVGGDPSNTASSLSDVRFCIRGGRILYSRPITQTGP